MKKTDNNSLGAKCLLRREVIKAAHGSDPIDVMDCCQGKGLIWRSLRKDLNVRSYWGLDIKPKRCRLKIDSSLILSQSGWTQNVIDIDTYGSPWKHWSAMLPNVSRPTTVFLTCGMAGGREIDSEGLKALGLSGLRIPKGLRLGGQLAELCVAYMLAKCLDRCKVKVAKCATATGRSVSYYGLHLIPKSTKK